MTQARRYGKPIEFHDPSISRCPASIRRSASPAGRHRAQAQSRPRLELGALHLVAHPDRRDAAAGPLEGLVLLVPLFWIGLRAFGGVSARVAASASSMRRNTSSRSSPARITAARCSATRAANTALL